jgi:putative colanic acid biosynthesis glycosyltransferase WcaI
LRLQLWSWNYAPEPTAMGPIAALWAETMRDRGHEVEVVAAHPHYPGPQWGQRALPYRERRNGIPVIRLPLLIGHTSTRRRIAEELTYAASAAGAMAVLGRPDAAVVVSPAFLALGPMIVRVRLRSHPWVLWLQDILPEAAMTTGLMRAGAAIRAARWLERAAYRSAARIVVPSEAFRRNLLAKSVDSAKVDVIPNPATHEILVSVPRGSGSSSPRLLAIGNIGYSQGLTGFVRTLEETNEDFELSIAGTGELAAELRREVRTARVRMLGLVSNEQLRVELDAADVGLVTQRTDIVEFNVPSKLATLMGRGLPVLASVNPASEVARIIRESKGGWICDSTRPEELATLLGGELQNPEERARRGAAALAYAQRHFSVASIADQFERVLRCLPSRMEPRFRAG